MQSSSVRTSSMLIIAKQHLSEITFLQIMFETRRLTLDDIDVTIDDLEFIDCAPPQTSDVACGSSQFTCANRVSMNNTTLASRLCYLRSVCARFA